MLSAIKKNLTDSDWRINSPSPDFQDNSLSEIFDELIKIDDLEVVLERGAEKVLRVLNAYSVSIALMNETKDALDIKIICSRCGKREPRNIKSFKLGSGVAGLAAQKEQYVYVNDITKSPLFICKNGREKGSILAVPLIFNHEVVGVLSISFDFPESIAKPTPALTVLALIIAATVANSKLLDREKELAKLKSNLVATATHELRTPLTAVRGYLSMLKDGDAGILNSKQYLYLNKALSSTDRLVSLVEDLLSTLRIDEKKVVINTTNFDLSKVIENVIDNLRSKADQKKIHINYRKKAKIFVNADSNITYHILQNLLDNAIKYTPDRGRISFEVSKKSKIIVSLTDTGCGISTKDQKIIFDRFSRVANKLSTKAGGTGLGLFIAKNLAETQGGNIWVESIPDQGSTFYLSLPLASN